MSIDQLTGGNIEPRGLEEEMRSSYLDYAMSVIVGRALPDVRDGLKPVHRRVLFSMHEAGLQPNRPFRKASRVVGDVMGQFHPHGDSAIYDTLVRLGQDFAMRYPLVEPQGNFGSIDNDPAAAMRYTEARLSRLATEMLRDIDADTVDFGPNYDESRQEPLVLPSRFPNLLVNGASGIAVGMATNIPPHNLRESIDAVVAYIDDPDIDVDGLMKHIKGPDFPTGGIIVGHGGIREAYETGRGRVVIRGKAHIEPMERGKERIIVTEMPYQVPKGDGRGDGSGLIKKIAEQVQNERIKEISDLRDESDRSGIRLVIELKRDVLPKVALNKLYKHTPLQTTFGVNMVALVDGVPRTLGLLPIVKNYVDHQREVIVRRTQHELSEREARLHILEGLLVAIADIDAVINLIRSSTDPDAARDGLMEHVRALAHPGAGDPRHAPGPADRARGRQGQAGARRHARAHQGAPRAARRRDQGHGPHQGGAARDPRALRRRAAHADHPLRGRDRHRGPDRRPADGHRDHALGLHQVAAARHVPPAEARRRGRHRHGHEGRGLHRAPLRVLDARLPPLLHQPRQGLPPEGLRAPGGPAHRQGPGAREHPPAPRGRARAVGPGHARLHRGQVPRVRDPRGPDQEDGDARLQHADQGRRHHRHQDPRRGRARGRPPHQRRRRHHHGLALGPGRSLQRGPRAGRWAATPAACAA